MKTLTLTLIFLFVISFGSIASEISCPKTISKGEGHWPIPSKEFSKVRYKQAIDALNNMVKTGSNGQDFINVENELLYVKGYMLKLYNERNAFCDFIKNEAYVRH